VVQSGVEKMRAGVVDERINEILRLGTPEELRALLQFGIPGDWFAGVEYQRARKINDKTFQIDERCAIGSTGAERCLCCLWRCERSIPPAPVFSCSLLWPKTFSI